MYLTEPNEHPLRVWAREVIQKKAMRALQATKPALTQATIDAREAGWEQVSESLNARFARVLGARES